ncbi:zinc/iron permease [Kipferlia bialata]|uniref:Zinc/iron permease n=1 Tax=Kipferlia bialata TaxID=797122 RepID=A0A9K3GLA5_9EUKA|nr:zinc/iron permease [Kipferlia bialata]|eukprot:g10074.t1
MSESGSPMFGLMLSTLAGLSTGIGGFIPLLFTAKAEDTAMAVGLGFSAGIMVLLSFMEMLTEAGDLIAKASPGLSVRAVEGIKMASFFCGICLLWILDNAVPEMGSKEDKDKKRGQEDHLGDESDTPLAAVRSGRREREREEDEGMQDPVSIVPLDEGGDTATKGLKASSSAGLESVESTDSAPEDSAPPTPLLTPVPALSPEEASTGYGTSPPVSVCTGCPRLDMAPDGCPCQIAKEAAARASAQKTQLLQAGIKSGVAIFIHNIPEAISVYITAVSSPMSVSVTLAVAIAIHNIPEGFAVASPIYAATHNRALSVGLGFLSGLSEPLGALLTYLFVGGGEAEEGIGMGCILGATAGMMVYLSLSELLPLSLRYDKHSYTMAGVFGGMALMALSLVLLA